jgi:hypothetical protein
MDARTVVAAPPAQRGGRRRGNPALVALYLALAVGGAAGTWYFNLRYDGSATGQSYWEAWFANAASSSAAVDVLVTAAAACVWYAVESIRSRRWWLLTLVPLTFVIALAFTVPLYLAVRELLGAPRTTVGAAAGAG